MKSRPTKLPTLETERLQLRQMRDDDAPSLFAIYGDPEVMRYAGDEPFPDEVTVGVMLQSVARLLAAGESLEWAVVERVSGQLVGTCGLHGFDCAPTSTRPTSARSACSPGWTSSTPEIRSTSER